MTVEKWLLRANRWVLVALMAAMAVLVFANVVSRYVLNYSLICVEELTRYLMVWVGAVQKSGCNSARSNTPLPLRVAGERQLRHDDDEALGPAGGNSRRERAVACESFISRSGGGLVVAMQKTEHRVRPRTFWQRRAMPHHVPELYSGLAPL